VSDLAAACTAGSILSGTKYVDNIKVGILRTSSPSLPTQYVSANISAVWYLDAATGALTFVSSQSYTTSSGSVNGTATTTATLGPFTFPEPTWNLATCTCDNVLHSVSYLVTHEAGGQVSSIPAPRIEAVVTSVTASSSAGVCGAAQVAQSYSVDWQLSDHVLSPPAEIIRPKSGNPGYLIGRPVLSGNLHTQLITPLAGGSAASVTRSAIAQDTNGMSVLPIADDGLCTPSSGGGTQQAVTFGQDAKFVCYLSLNLAQLQALCAAGVGVGGVLPYFGNISSMVGVWGSSSFEHVNEWVTLSVASPAAGTWFDGTRTCAGITTTVGLEFATTDAGAFKNPQTRILAARQTYATSTWQFLGEDPTLPQKFPVAATVTFVHVAATSIDVYTPRSPPLLPDFPNDLLYPLYIESAAPSTVSATSAASALLLSLLASALLTTLW
jgi:tectonic-1/3